MSAVPQSPVVQEVRVVVAVLTFRRPEELGRALPAIVEQMRALDCVDSRRVTVTALVVDNDPQASAAEVARAYPDSLVRYVCEPTPGITAGRNRALDEAGGADLLVFIDDDERPRAGWLAALVATWCIDRPAAVMGAVESVFAAEPDAFIRSGGFFARPRIRTGTPIPVAAAGNLLLDLAQVRAAGVRFDPRLGLSGGEDTLFSKQLSRHGARMVWCDEAIVDDFVPHERMTHTWVLRRAWRTGLSTIVTDLYLAETARARAGVRILGVGRGTVRVLGGAALHLLGLLTGSIGRRAVGLRALHRGRGMIAGARGVVYEEYARAG